MTIWNKTILGALTGLGVMSIAQAYGPGNPASYTSVPPGFKECAVDGGACKVPAGSTAYVVYGTNGKFATAQGVGDFTCLPKGWVPTPTAAKPQDLGIPDPVPNVQKKCFLQVAAIPTTTTTATTTPTTTTTKLQTFKIRTNKSQTNNCLKVAIPPELAPNEPITVGDCNSSGTNWVTNAFGQLFYVTESGTQSNFCAEPAPPDPQNPLLQVSFVLRACKSQSPGNFYMPQNLSLNSNTLSQYATTPAAITTYTATTAQSGMCLSRQFNFGPGFPAEGSWNGAANHRLCNAKSNSKAQSVFDQWVVIYNK